MHLFKGSPARTRAEATPCTMCSNSWVLAYAWAQGRSKSYRLPACHTDGSAILKRWPGLQGTPTLWKQGQDPVNAVLGGGLTGSQAPLGPRRVALQVSKVQSLRLSTDVWDILLGNGHPAHS